MKRQTAAGSLEVKSGQSAKKTDIKLHLKAVVTSTSVVLVVISVQRFILCAYCTPQFFTSIVVDK